VIPLTVSVALALICYVGMTVDGTRDEVSVPVWTTVAGVAWCVFVALWEIVPPPA
jgi:hypothetical protein